MDRIVDDPVIGEGARPATKLEREARTFGAACALVDGRSRGEVGAPALFILGDSEGVLTLACVEASTLRVDVALTCRLLLA